MDYLSAIFIAGAVGFVVIFFIWVMVMMIKGMLS
jgi:hypothetical protein